MTLPASANPEWYRDRYNPQLKHSKEGEWRGPFFGESKYGNLFELGSLSDGFQRHLNYAGIDDRRVAAVYACVMLNARAVSQCRPKHLRWDGEAWREQTDTRAASIMHRPNSYETWPQFILNIVADLQFEGEALAVPGGDDVLHRATRRSWSPFVSPEGKEVFYFAHGNAMFDPPPDGFFPAREVGHFKQHAPRHPLIGESPAKAAALAIGITCSLNASQQLFFEQMARPSGVLSTDMVLKRDQMKELRQWFEDQAKSMGQGGVPILSSGLKFQSTGVAQNDAQLIEQQRLSTVDIARVYSVPMALLAETGGPQGSTESLISLWHSIGLGSVIESCERTLDWVFRFDRNNRVELDVGPLFRAEFLAQIDGLTKGVQGSLYLPNEARKIRGLPPAPGGDQLLAQRQMTPVDQLQALNAAELARAAPAPAPEPEVDPVVTRALVADLIRKHMA